jgi:ribosomal protein S12 methylthiotransferase
MQHAQAISAARLAQKVGRTMRVLVDQVEGDEAIARSEGDAPEVDGVVRIADGDRLRIGEFATVRITGSTDYDLTARPARG